MADRIRNLLERVAQSEGSTDPVDAQLRDRLPAAARGVAALEREIVSEIAYSLGSALAERHLRDRTIQREALGIRRHTELLRLYPLPARLPSE